MEKDNRTPTRLTESRAPGGGGSTGFGRTMSQAGKNAKETTGMVTPTMPADEMRAARTTSDGIGDMARGMAGSTREKTTKDNQLLPPSKREPGTRPG